MTIEQATSIYEELNRHFPHIDARINTTKQPHFETATFREVSDVSIYQNSVCILVITSVNQYTQFIRLVESFQK